MRTMTPRAWSGLVLAALAATGCGSTQPFAKPSQPLNLGKTPTAAATAPAAPAVTSNGSWNTKPGDPKAPGTVKAPLIAGPQNPLAITAAPQPMTPPPPAGSGLPGPPGPTAAPPLTGVQPAGYNAPNNQPPAILTANSAPASNGIRLPDGVTRTTMPVPAPTGEPTPATPQLPQPVPPSMDVPPPPPPLPSLHNMPTPSALPAASQPNGPMPPPPASPMPPPVTLPPVKARPQD